MNKTVEEFRAYREKMNKSILDKDNLVIKRIFNLDTKTYEEGALDIKTKELIGLCTSLVLRCDDCVKYHLEQCSQLGITTEQLMEAMSVSNLVGGTIVIPHLRKAVEYWDILHS